MSLRLVLIILDIELIGVARVLLINLYGPNDDNPVFYQNLFNKIENLDTKNLIICGDWNLVMNYEIDTKNYRKKNNVKARETVLNYMDKLDLLDIWRKTHETVKRYTWRQNFYKKLARLDFFLISETLLDIYANSEIKQSYKSDHSPVQLEIFISKTQKGKGIWKLNNSLLLDEELNTLINKEIQLTVSIYACTPYHPDFIQNYTTQNIEFMINIDLFWEVLQGQLRGVIISYASKKKRNNGNREKQLKTEIEEKTKEIHQNISDQAWMNDFKRKEEELIELREHKLKGALIRARWQQITEGEKPSKYFLNLENRNFVSKHIREIKKGTININNPKEILEEMKIFYESLYKNQQTDSLEESNYKHLADKMPKLNETDRLNIEKEISLEELKTTVYKSKNNKSPGPDGFSNEFYKKFWTQIKQLLLKLMLFYRERGSLNKNQISGIITCIPKGGKLRNDLKKLATNNAIKFNL